MHFLVYHTSSLPSSLTFSFHIWRRSVRPLLFFFHEHATYRNLPHSLVGSNSNFQMAKGVECKWCECLYPSMFHISCRKQYIKYGEGMLGYCPHPPSPQLYIHDCT